MINYKFEPLPLISLSLRGLVFLGIVVLPFFSKKSNTTSNTKKDKSHRVPSTPNKYQNSIKTL